MLLFILLFKLFYPVADDDYYVSHIKGNVTMAANNKPIVVGDKLHLKDALIFGDASDFVAVINPVKGRFIINRIKALPPTKLNEIMLVISENIVPVTLPQTLAGRGVIHSLADLSAFFNRLPKGRQDASPPLMLMDTLKIELAASEFTDRDNKYFFLRYKYRTEIINKKLDYQLNGNGLQLLIDRRIYQVDGRPIMANEISATQLFYYDSQLKQTRLISAVDINAVNAADIASEVNVLFANFWQLYKQNIDKKEEINHLISDAITGEYGFSDKQQLGRVINAIETKR